MIGNNFIQYFLCHDSKITKNLLHRHKYIYMNKIQNMEIILKKNVDTNLCRGCRAITCIFHYLCLNFKLKANHAMF